MFEQLKEKIRSKIAPMSSHVPTVFGRIFHQIESDAQLWQERGAKIEPPPRTYYEFGIWNGYSMNEARKAVRSVGGDGLMKQWRFFGFDSFEGLPNSDDERDIHSVVGAGAFKSVGQEQVYTDLIRKGFLKSQLKLIPGFFQDSLTADLILKEELPKVSFANLDVDYYSSTITILDWLEPLLDDGAFVYMDDILFYNGNPHKGQLKAVSEFNEKNTSCGLYKADLFDPAGRVYMFWRDNSDSIGQNLAF